MANGPEIHIDLETRSRTDLQAEGVYNYATDPSTEIICMAWAFGNGEIRTWRPDQAEFPESLARYIEQGVPLAAHNAAFERLMFDYIICPDFDVPHPVLEQWRCTAYQARCNNLPGALFNCARALGVKQQKDRAGRNLIAMLSVPQADGEFNYDPTLLDEMTEYCAQDVRAERDIHAVMREPTIEEWLDYYTSERINDRGVRVDMPMVKAAQAYAREEEADIIAMVTELSDGEITKFRGSKLLEWVRERITPVQLDSLKVYRGGEKKYSLDKHSRHRLLDHDDLDPVVREVVSGADTASKSSIGKFKAMERRADPEDGRMRGAFVANGASASGRFSSWGAQVHNFPRFVNKKRDEVREDLIDNIYPEDMVEYFDSPMMSILSGQLRPSLIPADGKEFQVSDWSAIEGRINPWLTYTDDVHGTPSGLKKVELYRSGVDTYKVAASSIYGVPYSKIDDDQRQVGKVAELALGYQGGVNAFQGMARNYGITVPAADAERIKAAWRRANAWAVDSWKNLERAAQMAVKNPGSRFAVGRVSYFCVTGILIGEKTLFCELPDGRLLTYPDVRFEMKPTPWGEEKLTLTAMRSNWTPKATEKTWPRSSLYGGLLCENNTQATAASLLRCKLREADESGLDVVLHVHDELVVEADTGESTEVLEHIMNTPPEWARTLPLVADVQRMEAFGK